MEYLVNIYTKKPELVETLFEKNVNISIKVDGSAFQISYDKANDNVEYHKRGGSSSKIGPVIDDYTKMFAPMLNKAIDFFSEKNPQVYEEIKKNKFLAIELLDSGHWVLLTAIDENDNIINAGPELEKKASNLNIFSVPFLFEGKLKADMKQQLLDMCTLDENTSNEDFVKLILKLFPQIEKQNNRYHEFLKNSEVEGIVLTWDLDGKIAQYKIINPSFKKRHEGEKAAEKERAEKNQDALNGLIELLVDKADNEAEKLDDNHLKSLEYNFLKFITDIKFLNKLINTSAKVMPNQSKYFFLQTDKVSKDMQKKLKKHGTPLITAFEQFVMTFNKERKKSFIISKEFQERINAIIANI